MFHSNLIALFTAVAIAFASGSSVSAQHADAPSASPQTSEPLDKSLSWWRPTMEMSWQIQFSGELDTTLDVDVFVLDLFDTPVDTIAELQAQGRAVICYFSAGSWEEWRPDAGEFRAEVIGSPLAGWPGEFWLDVRTESVRDVMLGRLDLAVSKGCDGVDPDNVDGFANESGFPLTPDDQLGFNRFLASEAHARGLGIGLKNDLDQIPELVMEFDWAINEECFVYDECERLQPFVLAGKPVFQIEYGPATRADLVCEESRSMRLNTLIKNLGLDAARTACLP